MYWGIASPSVCADGLYLRRSWGGEYENVAILAAIAVNEDGYREVSDAVGGMKEDRASRVGFLPVAACPRPGQSQAGYPGVLEAVGAAKMLKVIAQDSKKTAKEAAKAMVEELHSMKLNEAVRKAEDGMEGTLPCFDFPSNYRTRVRTSNLVERLSQEIRRRTRAAGCFPDGNSASCRSVPDSATRPGTQRGNKST